MGLKVLSLFDGMSCGQIALRELVMAVDRYYSSEVDRHCTAQTRLNFPDTMELGDVRSVDGTALPKIDLVLAGSPCQGFSMAGKMLNFDDPRSGLFFEFCRVLGEVRKNNPDVKFLLENVRMKREYMERINEIMGLRPVAINSALVSAQNRVRLYWTNILTDESGTQTAIPQPEDRGLVLRDILESNPDERYYMKAQTMERLKASKARREAAGCGFGLSTRGPEEKSNTVTVGGKSVYDIVKLSRRGDVRPRQDKASCLTVGGHGGGNHSDMDVLEINSEADTIYRRLTPTECARLQTIPEWYKWECSATQQYKMLGNGWTVEVIKHILSYLKQ